MAINKSIDDLHSLLIQVVESLTPAQRDILSTISQITTDEESFNQELVNHPELLMIIQTAMMPDVVALPDKLQAILKDLAHLTELHEMPHRVRLSKIAIRLVQREEHAELWAGLQVGLGDSLAQNPLGSRAANLEKAIFHYRQALEIYTHSDFPVDWALTQNNLAIAYTNRIEGDRSANLERAIFHCKQALKIRTRFAFPRQWAMTHNDLANAYSARIKGKRAENLEQAIFHCKKALEVFTRSNFAEEWSMVQDNLASNYADRIKGVRAENLERSIFYYEQALEVRTRDSFPVYWAVTQNNLATAYWDRIKGKRAENLEQAIFHYCQSLEVRTRYGFPEQWAMTQNNLATAFRSRIKGERAENLEQSLFHYRQALKIYTRKRFPNDWAITEINLAVAYLDRIKGKRIRNIEKVIFHCNQALEIITNEAFPFFWATLQSNLGIAYRDRIEGEQAENIEKAVFHSERALKIFTRRAFPIDWARTQYNLATIYTIRIKGDRGDNLELAIYHCEQALEVQTYKAFPIDWAAAKNNLAAIYINRIRGERAENLEKAVFHCEQALEVYNRIELPIYWAMTQNHLAMACLVRIEGERAANLEEAIFHCEQALEIFARRTHPIEWARAQNNLAAAYWDRIEGERTGNLEQAIFHYKQSLKVRTRDAFPEEWAGTQNNLATAYIERLKGKRSGNSTRAIFHCEQALKVYTRNAFPIDWARTQNNLATAYFSKIQREKSDFIEQAVFHYKQALEVRTLEHLPSDHRQTQRNLGDLYFNHDRWAEAEVAFYSALEAGQVLLEEAYTEVGRRSVVLETAELFSNYTYCCLKLKQFDKALQYLEQGKTRLLTESLAISGADISFLPEDQALSVLEARETIRILKAEMLLPRDTSARRADRESAETMRVARSTLKKLIKRIRIEKPEFMSPGLNVAELLALIPSGGALVAPIICSRGGAVFVVPHGSLTVGEDHVIWLDEFGSDRLQTLLYGSDSAPGWLTSYLEYRDTIASSQTNQNMGGGSVAHKVFRLVTAEDQWHSAILAITEQLWKMLVSPIHERLELFGLSKGAPILLIPQGGLGVLPLHAAWRPSESVPSEQEETIFGMDGRHYWQDDINLIYAPSGYALSVGFRRLHEFCHQQHSLLAVINPTKDLKFTAAEGNVISAMFDKCSVQILSEEKATAEAVKIGVIGKSYVHFSCHGFYDWQEAMRSGLVLSGGVPLTLVDIINNLDLSSSRLVTLSACETGLTELRQSPDEYIGLPAGFLQIGAPAVISTLWIVDDLSTMLLIERFYEYHLRKGMKISESLRMAQLWLRDVTAEELQKRFSEGMEALGKARIPAEVASELFRRVAELNPKERPFSHPYYWAAFTFYGAQ
jgi:CHAT domain-containing protein/tetratricopeptide (TPR) repeat protein